MLTIQNVRKDIGLTIGEYTLCDGGLSSVKPNGDGEYYSFYWNAYGIPRRFKFLLDRVPASYQQSIYRLRLYDTKLATPGTNRDGFVVETKVGRILLKKKVDFYSLMLKTMEEYK
jgi:hypothetical protein